MSANLGIAPTSDSTTPPAATAAQACNAPDSRQARGSAFADCAALTWWRWLADQKREESLCSARGNPGMSRMLGHVCAVALESRRARYRARSRAVLRAPVEHFAPPAPQFQPPVSRRTVRAGRPCSTPRRAVACGLHPRDSAPPWPARYVRGHLRVACRPSRSYNRPSRNAPSDTRRCVVCCNTPMSSARIARPPGQTCERRTESPRRFSSGNRWMSKPEDDVRSASSIVPSVSSHGLLDADHVAATRSVEMIVP